MKIRYILSFLIFGTASLFSQSNQDKLPAYKEINNVNFSNEEIAKLYFDENTKEYIEKGIITKKIDVNLSHGSYGESFLSYCNKDDSEEWLALSKLMLDNGGNINKLNENGSTPLIQVIRRCNINQFNLYLNYKPDWKKYDYFSNVLYSINFRKNITINEDGTVSDYFSDKIGMTFAAFLIQNGQNINKKDKYGMAPLHYICESNSENMKSAIYYLIAHGADVNQLTKNKQTPLYLLVRNIYYWNAENVECLLENGVDPSKERMAFDFIQSYTLRNYGEYSYSIREAQKIARLMCEYKVAGTENLYIGSALSIGYLPMVEELLEKETSINWEAKEDSYKMLDYAIWSDDPEVVKLVLKKNPNLQGEDKYSREGVIVTAVRCNNPEIVKLLLEAGADPNKRTYYDYTRTEPALVYAKTGEMAKVLLEHGANPNLIYDTYWENTIAMKLASNHCNKDVFKEVLKYSDLSTTSKRNESVYDYLPNDEYKELFYAELERRYKNKKLTVTKNLPVREAATTSRPEILVLKEGSIVSVLDFGKYDQVYHGVWLKVRVLKGSKNESGKAVQDVTGWCLSNGFEN